MPEMGGHEVARLPHYGRTYRPPIHIVESRASPEYGDSHAGAGMDGVLVKSVRLADLIRIIEQRTRP